MGENACFFGEPFPGKVRITTLPCRFETAKRSRSQSTAHRSSAPFAATLNRGDGKAIVQAQRSTRYAGGGESGSSYAVSGTVTGTKIRNLGDAVSYGVIGGSIDATLAWTDGSNTIAVRGKWGCVIDSIAN